MKKALLVISLSIICPNVVAQDSGSSGNNWHIKEPVSRQKIDTRQIEDDLKNMISDIDKMINKAVTARHMYGAVMEPAQELVAMCKSASARRSSTKKARMLLQQRCDEEKQQLKSRLYSVAEILEETKSFEKQMVEEAKTLREIISVSEGFEAIKPGTDRMNKAIQDLQNIRSSLERQMEEDIGDQ